MHGICSGKFVQQKLQANNEKVLVLIHHGSDGFALDRFTRTRLQWAKIK